MGAGKKQFATDKDPFRPSWLVPLCLGLIIVLGFAIRIEDLRAWNANPAKAFYDGEPLLTNVDGYYYLRIARDLAEDKYLAIDPLRTTPEHPARPAVPPLLSVITAALHNITNLSFNWIAVLLPTVLGMLLVFPLYGIGKSYGGPLAGIVAALAGILSNTYFVRTSIGWFDTDCLNVTLSFTAVYFFLRFGREEQAKRYWFFLAGIANWLLFLWWWDQAPQPVTVISLAPLIIALLFYYRPSRKLRTVLFVAVSLALAVFLLWKGGEILQNFYRSIAGHLSYLTGEDVGLFPNVSQLVGEQRNLKFIQVVKGVTDSYPVLLLGIIGIGWLVVRHPKKSLFLAIPLLLSIFGIFWAQRFLIFVGPVFGLGLGFLVAELWKLRLRFSIFCFAVPALVALVVWINLKTDVGKTQWSKFNPGLVEGFQYLGKNTPQNSVIWAWWDWGHPLIYWSERAAISDGAAHGGEVSVYNAIPYATSNPRLAANLIKFYTVQGKAGFHTVYKAAGNNPGAGLELLKAILGAGPVQAEQMIINARLNPTGSMTNVHEWLAFFFPKADREIFLFIDYRLGYLAYWWYWVGTWNIDEHQGVHSRYMPFQNVETDEAGATNHENFYADFKKGEILLLDSKKNMRALSVFDLTGKIQEEEYPHDAMAYLEIFKPAHYAALQRKDIKNSMFNRLFLRHELNDYFRPVKLNTPVYQIYQVFADTIEDGHQ